MKYHLIEQVPLALQHHFYTHNTVCKMSHIYRGVQNVTEYPATACYQLHVYSCLKSYKHLDMLSS